MKGRILSVIAGVYSVYLEDQTIINIRPKGRFRHLKIKPCVGDHVEVNNGVIDSIYERKNILNRPSISNIDIGVIVVSMREPIYTSYLLDKFLTILNMNNIEPLIILSKEDLCKEKVEIEDIINQYKRINIDVIPFSKHSQINKELILEKIKYKTIAFIGQTGVGKSSIINCIFNNYVRKIGEYSTILNRGKHQTKEVIILPLNDTFVADTPGFSSLEIYCYKEELKEYFPFIKEYQDCYYSDCYHINEPKCQVSELAKVDNHFLEHYNNYRKIYDELISRKDRYR